MGKQAVNVFGAVLMRLRFLEQMNDIFCLFCGYVSLLHLGSENPARADKSAMCTINRHLRIQDDLLKSMMNAFRGFLSLLVGREVRDVP